MLIEKNYLPGRSRENSFKKILIMIIAEDQAVATVFNKFFGNIVPNLKISTDHGYHNDFIVTNDQNYKRCQ